LCLDVGRQFVAGQRRAERSGNLAEVDNLRIQHEPLIQFGQQCLHQYERAGRLMSTAIDGNDFERG
jgi:hypothetical protein